MLLTEAGGLVKMCHIVENIVVPVRVQRDNFTLKTHRFRGLNTIV
jgi:hypothetical protein